MSSIHWPTIQRSFNHQVTAVLRAGLVCTIVGSASAAVAGDLTIRVLDADTGQPLPCRMHVKNHAGVPRKVSRMPFWHDHFVFDGEVRLSLPKGNYTFELEHGPEYVNFTGHFRMVDFADDSQTLQLKRGVDLAREGWWSGDLHVVRRLEDLDLLTAADGVHVTGAITWNERQNPWSRRLPEPIVAEYAGNRFVDQLAGRVGRPGSSLLVFNVTQPIDSPTDDDGPLAIVDRLTAARRESPALWVDVDKPFAWELPLWLSFGLVDSIGVANEHVQRDAMLTNEAGGRPRDKSRYRDPWGIGEWSHDIYFHVLNCGFRIPPSAGSGSGRVGNPVGYNRMYVHVEPDEFSYPQWWKNFRLGRVTVTNGPMIRPVANGRLPGEVFRSSNGQPLELEVSMNLSYLSSRDRLSYLELIQDGRVAHSVRFDDWKQTGRFPPLKFTRSGWCLVRVVVEADKMYRFALSAPWYVDLGDDGPAERRASGQFMLDWFDEWMATRLTEEARSAEAHAPRLKAARQFWQDRVDAAAAP